jgi:putative acetyltransferase
MIRIIRTTSENPDFKSLTEQLDFHLAETYGAFQHQYDPLNKTDRLGTVVVACEGTLPVGCGCFKKQDDTTAEIKRMFVKPEWRGRGIAGTILNELEKWAAAEGCSKSVLETGIRQTGAIRLYDKAGYKRIENYGPYQGNTNSVCLEKTLINQ